jgi:hypothetical protein
LPEQANETNTLINQLVSILLTGFNKSRTTDSNEAFFVIEIQLGLTRQIKQINSGEFGKFLAKTISTHFGTVSPLSMFSIIQLLLLQKTMPLYLHPKHFLGLGFEFELGRQIISNLAFVCT